MTITMLHSFNPSIILYRSNSKSQEADELRDFIAMTKYSFVEKNVSDDPDYHSKLIKQFGGQLSFPGIRVKDQFVSIEQGDLERVRSYGDYWLEELLMPTEDSSCGSSESELNIRLSSNGDRCNKKQSFDHSHSNPGDIKYGAGSITAAREETMGMPQRQTRALSLGSANTGVSEMSSASSSFVRDIMLPNGQVIATVDLTRKLLAVIHHSVLRANGKQWYYFRGQHALDVLDELFFSDSTDVIAKEREMKAFANQLVDRGIFIDWTPECIDFRSTFLVMYNFCQPHVLNTLIKWPADDAFEDDPMNAILRLSRDMDEICIWENYQREDKVFVTLYKSLEEKICQLQVIHFPHDPVERVTFALNLFNLIIRHAMIMAPKRQWRWPSSLEEFDAFTHHIGYDVGGEIVTLAFLRESLHGTKGQVAVPLVATKPSFWEQFSCLGEPRKLRDVHYEGPVVRTDCRVLFATTWGCHSSPTVSTVYPYQLSEGLRTAAEIYCQQNVIVRGNQIVLPAMLSWFRNDFGGNPDTVVKTISRFLSPEQLAPVVELTRLGVVVEVIFDDSFDWQPGIPAPRKDIELQFASKDFPSATLPAFASETNTLAGCSRASNTSFVSRLSRMIMPTSVPLFGRQSSDGESEVKPRRYGRATSPYLKASGYPQDEMNGCQNDSVDNDQYYYQDDDDDDDTTFNPETIVSALTLGSEFGDIRFQAERTKKSYSRLAPHNVRPQHPSTTIGQSNLGYGYGYGGETY